MVMVMGSRHLLLACCLCAAASGQSLEDAMADQASMAMSVAASKAFISEACGVDLERHASCFVKSTLFTLCTQGGQLGDLREYFGCQRNESRHECQEECLAKASALLGEKITGPCDAKIQAMQAFSGHVNLFTLPKIEEQRNMTSSLILPFPNAKGLTGLAVSRLGEPSKCVEVPSAQYCILSGFLSASGQQAMSVSFALGNCLPKTCSETDLEAVLRSLSGNISETLGLRVQCGLVEAAGVASGPSAQVQELVGWGGVPVRYPSKQPVTTGFVVMMAFLGVVAVLLAAGTAVHWRQESKRSAAATAFAAEAQQPLASDGEAMPPQPPRSSAVEGFLMHWSLLRNGRSFFRTRSGDQNPFACMDAIRTLSMCQVVLGHMFVYPMSSSGMQNMEQFSPPDGLMGQTWFMIVPGCFYGVDSFFLLSGFLCCYNLQKKVFSAPESRSVKSFCTMYPKFAFMRFLRLQPLQMLCIALCMFVLPLLGTGLLWNMDRSDGQHCFDGAGASECASYWWTNLLFLQDFDQYVGKCFAHTWYLANDMQLYLTAPFFCLAYSIRRSYGWIAVALGLLVGVSCPIIIAAQNNMAPDTMLAGNEYMQKIYMKPYCRCTPFFVGIALAWLWQEGLSEYAFRHRTAKGGLVSYALSFLGLGICAACIFGRVVFYQGDIATITNVDTNPAGKLALYLWGGFSILGWSVGLGMIMILCFQHRFLPLLQQILNLPLWQPFAKLSYAAYLVHTSVLIMDFCQQSAPLEYTDSGFYFAYVACLVTTMFAALGMYLCFEKPVANLQMKLLGGGVD